ncbi:transmembrane sensor [Catalinimonas alkaloidigena]|uniref:FecR family protein n=1 Tax=Catalinimonas alkaloidigena TaxID=1075417 RepID=UPI00240598D3|nr:FecR domain-containing protein [Catalinimonas alkaloidigena]MDF9799329.1 transmembrane sensor [Catalinimonas alkaloidigena]
MKHAKFYKYADFQVEDFLNDEYFQEWIVSPDEEKEAYWKEYVLRFPLQKEKVEEARKLFEGLRYTPYSLSKEKQDEMLQRINTHASALNYERSAPFYQKKYFAVAASLSLVILSTLFWLVPLFNETYETTFQETKTVVLSDGSEVTLNANSKIKVVIDTEENQPREVWLEGEAYFEVKHLDEKMAVSRPNLNKFVVHTANLDIEVLGTTFNVSSRSRKSEVLLKEGSIKVASEQVEQTQILKPGDLLALSVEDKDFHIKKMERDVELPWRENFFVFQNTPLKEVAKIMEDYYGVQVEIIDVRLRDKIFTAKVYRSDLPILLQAIEASFNVKVNRQGSKIQISH